MNGTKPQKYRSKKPIRGLARDIPSRFYVAAAIALPLITWCVAALINPSGWMSDLGPLMAVSLMVPVGLWYISTPLAILLAVLIWKKKRKIAAILTFILSVLWSIFLFHLTATADESEFVG